MRWGSAFSMLTIAATLACGGTDPDPATAASDASTTPDAPIDPLPDVVAEEKPLCGLPQVTYVVPTPAPGVTPDVSALCAAASPVTSTGAARITLSSYAASAETARGFVAIPAAVLAAVVGSPTLAVVSAEPQATVDMVVSNVTPVAGGFAFDASWPKSILHGDDDNTRLAVSVTFTISCGDGATQTVTAVTNLDTCISREGFLWVGSGGSCTFCQHPPKA